MLDMDWDTLKRLPQDFAIKLVWIFFAGFAVGFLAGQGATFSAALVLLSAAILSLVFKRKENGRS